MIVHDAHGGADDGAPLVWDLHLLIRLRKSIPPLGLIAKDATAYVLHGMCHLGFLKEQLALAS